MNADSAFAMGHRHEVCQDYALSECEDGATARAWVSDGCSSSEFSDVGSRLLTWSARNVDEDSDDFGLAAIAAAKAAADVLRLRTQALDATLLSMQHRNKSVIMRAFGDGVFVWRWENGTMCVGDLDYLNGYPDYLSYRLDADRRAIYDGKWQGGSLTKTWSNADGNVVQEVKSLVKHKGYIEERMLDSHMGGLKLALVMTDGVKSFYSGSDPIPLPDVLDGLLKFKLFTGRFVQRRLNRFLKDCAKAGWHHHDDIAVAAIHFGG